MLWTIIAILLAVWLVGLLTHIGGPFIHVLLILAAGAVGLNLVFRRSAA